MKYILLLILAPFLVVAQLPDSLLSISQFPGLPNNISINDIVVTESNVKYIATDEGLYKVIDKYSPAQKLKDGNFQALCTNKKEDVWAMEGNSLHSLTEVVFTAFDGIDCNKLIYHKGSIWIASNSGLYRINPKSKKRTALYRQNNSKLQSDIINFVFADPDDQIWIGTDNGLAFISKKGRWKLFEKGLSMESMTYNKEGLWLVTDKEMWVIDAFGRWYPAALNKGLKDGVVRDITTDKDGRLILASNSLVRFNPYIDEIHSYTNTLAFLAQQTNSIEGDANQDIWIGTENNGLYVLSFGDTKVTDLSAVINLDKKISCTGSNRGEISVKTFGGNPPYKYKWDDKANRGKKLTGLKEGTYKVTVTDNNNNSYATQTTLINPYPLNLRFDDLKRISEAGMKDGAVTLNISGGVPPYTFGWEDGSTLQNRIDLGAGVYKLTITDKDDCIVVTEFEIPAEKFIPQLDLETIAVGQTLKINQLFFEADSSSLSSDFKPVLDEIYSFLKKNPSVVVEIGGHTNNKPPKDVCYRLSNARAKSIAEYMYRKGIESTRISYKGYGKDFPIADNNTLAGRKQNQRVEMKILSI